ncbi:uncharacterized protein LOC103313009 isoform X2 [Tribolium castaneum]|uniref:uncharacterized protein LOC103313009 isoform X2 n=1 Tax=Tribolium castaneum TaxID=7070 RepID=UPI00046BEF6A|nr:PREDICTED: uncharacterized protein LOC103313009 [Tribolium castaneum]|eukprot:XP_008193351.1 PREDICTED: uncharacterized protein LOC103313009 [Tribolium castaneum]
MKLFVILFLQSFFIYLTIGTPVTGDSSCDVYGTLIYEDFGCTPEHDNASKCPSRFSCKGLEPSKDQCYFRGRAYQNREEVNTSLLLPSCESSCFCQTNENRARFTCAITECAEELGRPFKKGCYGKYTLDSCCSVGEVCPPFDDDAKCVVDGEEYKEGQEFFPKNTCLQCVCQKGFNGKFEAPFCRRRWCGVQLRSSGVHSQNSCAPFYSLDSNTQQDQVLCCPNGWLCPDGSEVITGEEKSEHSCKFGDKIVKVGQSFERNNFTDSYGRHAEKVKCECVIPPLVKCTGALVTDTTR